MKITLEKLYIFFIFLLKTYIVGIRRGGSNENSKCEFWIKNKKYRYPCKPRFCSDIKVGFYGVYFSRRRVFLMTTVYFIYMINGKR